ncbi:MAG: site-specific DNA-methyltransferase [Planctomycetota bacterium]
MPIASLGTSLGRIHAGDCIEGMRQLPDQCVDLVFADPPFNIGYDYDVYDDSLESDEYLKWCQDWIAQVHRVTTADGAFWLAIGDEYAAELKVLSQRLGFVCRSWVIWYYTFGVHCKLKFTRSHAHLFHFVKDPRHFKFNADDPAVRVPSARQLVYNDRRANAKGRMPDDTWILRPQDCPTGFTTQEDVWYFPRVAGTFKERAGFHGCQMPEQLLGRILRSCSHVDDVVMDPFSGSATTVAVAKKLGRRFLAFDMSEEYVELGSQRLRRIEAGDPLEGAPDPLRRVQTNQQAQTSTSRRRRATQSSSLQLSLAFDGDADELSTIDARLLNAWDQVHGGFSLDRVLVDPVLRRRLLAHCRAADLSWPMSELGRRLLQLRAMGCLKTDSGDTERATVLDPKVTQRFSTAAEIAWRTLCDRVPGWSLEECFLDDDLARQFDSVARLHAPETDAFALRWIALQLREQAAASRIRAEDSQRSEGAWTDSLHLVARHFEPHESRLGSWPRRGLVRLQDKEQRTLFVGATDQTVIRLRDHFATEALWDHWETLARGDVEVSAMEVPSEVSLGSAMCTHLRAIGDTTCNCMDLWLPASDPDAAPGDSVP